MTVEAEIKAALTTTALPCVKNEYTGAATTYLTFNYATIPDYHADNRPNAERYLIQLHLMAPATLDTETLQTQIKALLKAAGFSYPASDDISEGAPTHRQHIVFEFERVKAI